jgi:quercetin dioxygenase-like cupin family protein
MKRMWMAAAAMVAGAAAAGAQPGDRLGLQELDWRQMFPGVHFAPAYGAWEEGAHGKYVRIVPGTEIPLHTHPGGYHAVMLSGRMVNILDRDTRVELAPGDSFEMAGGRLHAHDCVSQEPCLFYTHSGQAWSIEVPEAR